MSAKSMPGAGLLARWDLGENGWNTGMDENLARMSALAQLSVPSVTAALDTAAGVQIAPASHASAGQVAAYIEGAWWFFQPFVGMRAFVRDAGRTLVYTATGWMPASEISAYVVNAATGSYVLTEAEFQVGAVIVVTSETDVIVTVPAGSGVTVPGSNIGRRPVTLVQGGEGRITIAGATGVTVSAADGIMKTRMRNSVASIIPIGAVTYVACGDLAA